MALEIIGHLGLKVVARLGPLLQKTVEFLDTDEQVLGPAHFGTRARERAQRIDQFGGAVVVAVVATVSVLVGQAAERAGALDEPVGQKRTRLGVVELLHILLEDQPGPPDVGPDFGAQFAVLGAVGAAVVVELDVEPGKVLHMGLLHARDQLFFGDAFLACADHDRRAVSIVRANIDTTIAVELLETDPDVRLQVLHQMAEMDMAVGIRQGRGHQNLSHSMGSSSVDALQRLSRVRLSPAAKKRPVCGPAASRTPPRGCGEQWRAIPLFRRSPRLHPAHSRIHTLAFPHYRPGQQTHCSPAGPDWGG